MNVAARRVVAVSVHFVFAITTAAIGQESPPVWAYPINPPDMRGPQDDGQPRRVPDSEVALSLKQIQDRFFASDWHPGEHPPLPEVVARGRKPDVFACGFCHRADGPGGPENANLRGLPVSYIKQQMADFKSGVRTTSVAARGLMNLKKQVATNVTAKDLDEAARYFSGLQPRSIVKVVESESAPKTYVTSWHLAPESSGESEPLGERIIEVPTQLENFFSRDSHAQFTAYVPPGSIQKGRELATTGGGRTVPCAGCHGPDLKGIADIPGIAGRSPSYLVRQMYDLKHGSRAGAAGAVMKPVVEKLAVADMIVLAAYAASLAP